MVGAVVLAALVALGWMILKFSSTSATSFFAHGTHFQLTSARVDGVNEGSPLTYLGVQVGRVLGVRREPNNAEVVVDAVIDAPQPLPRNVIGMIRQQSPLGSAATISLEPIDGKPSTETLQEGDKIRAQFAGSGVIPAEFTAIATEVRQQKLVEHMDELVMTIRQDLEKAGKTLDALNSITGESNFRDDIKTTIANVRQTSERLNQFSGRLDELTNETRSTMGQIRTSVADTSQNVSAVSKSLDQRLEQIGVVLNQVQSITTKIDKGQGTGGQLVNDPRLYESMVDTSKELNETVRTLKRLAAQWEQEGVSIKGFK